MSLGIIIRVGFGDIEKKMEKGTDPILELPFINKLPIPQVRNFEFHMSRIHSIADTILQQRKADPPAGLEIKYLIDVLLDSEDDETLTAEEVRDIVVIFLFAGSETTSTVLTLGTCKAMLAQRYQNKTTKGDRSAWGINNFI